MPGTASPAARSPSSRSLWVSASASRAPSPAPSGAVSGNPPPPIAADWRGRWSLGTKRNSPGQAKGRCPGYTQGSNSIGEPAMRLTDFKVLTFDCYGTLIDWESGILAALRPLLGKLGGKIDDEAALVAF